MCTAALIGLRPCNSPLPLAPHLGSYTRSLLVSQDRRHLFVTSGQYIAPPHIYFIKKYLRQKLLGQGVNYLGSSVQSDQKFNNLPFWLTSKWFSFTFIVVLANQKLIFGNSEYLFTVIAKMSVRQNFVDAGIFN
jgi:hypothetical protein